VFAKKTPKMKESKLGNLRCFQLKIFFSWYARLANFYSFIDMNHWQQGNEF